MMNQTQTIFDSLPPRQRTSRVHKHNSASGDREKTPGLQKKVAERTPQCTMGLLNYIKDKHERNTFQTHIWYRSSAANRSRLPIILSHQL